MADVGSGQSGWAEWSIDRTRCRRALGQVAGLARAGLPLAQGLKALSEELPRGRLKRSILDLTRTLESGVPLDQAVKGNDKSVPPHLRGLVVAGMRSGEMGDLLDRFSDHLRVGIELKRKLWLNLAYPILTIGIAVTLFVFICVFVVSQFESVYGGFGIPVPAVTLALLAVGRFVNSTWLSGAIVIAFFGCILLAARLLLPRPISRSLAARLPLIGPVWRSTSLAEFCHLLALLLESRLTLARGTSVDG